MRVTPVSPMQRTARDTSAPREHAGATPRAVRQEPATRPYAGASVILELYGNPLTFGLFDRYGSFSAKV
jgi:hypothetical protein